ncbi:plasmid pRiA4b ORF-3 family protein [Xylanimonas cellulosilytica DSM 15894]|uniref:Plasmid pRiA4b ORF-3 family protein n=1 Tax=Xylanimonas cellulosilytica (strain DSM 15894 / JCM 12276 / CECT 5975 / KCTC 9989 / LMG 20990 / NBRC 107835 / XIL07) TaxID=446471 RepID=D1BSD9_XYLCX|nr:plasmid pRiA4b ORF-3 family protein [Xylanimonas cellulosilytica]ACZ30631.1 plasmid pRiA4b ORF-3 family protein [Xylanimonas cellulosilytica DSM 15894]
MTTSEDELRAKLEELVAQVGIGAVLDAFAVGPVRRHRPTAPPRSRHPRRDDVVVLRVRVDLNRAKPSIWRRLDLRSDLTLDVVHDVLQDAFGWTDSHLHSFWLSAETYDHAAERYLCPYDIDEGDLENLEEDDGVRFPEEQIRLDEVLAAPGNVLAYLYDYGDNWDLTLRLEQVMPLTDDGRALARCVDGRRAAPPDDSGSVRTAGELAEVLDDPAHFDIASVNTALTGPLYELRRRAYPRRLIDMLAMLEHDDPTTTLAADLAALPDPPEAPSDEELAAALRSHLWLLDRAADGGIPLTAAGYLKPADVEALSALLPTMAGWIGKANREDLTWPVAEFREHMVKRLGLLRKHTGRLLLTRAGAAARGRPRALLAHLASRLRPTDARSFADDTDLLVLAYAATGVGTQLPWAAIGAHLGEIGYQMSDGSPVDRASLRHASNAGSLLEAIGERSEDRRSQGRVSAVAGTLAHTALRR